MSNQPHISEETKPQASPIEGATKPLNSPKQAPSLARVKAIFKEKQENARCDAYSTAQSYADRMQRLWNEAYEQARAELDQERTESKGHLAPCQSKFVEEVLSRFVEETDCADGRGAFYDSSDYDKGTSADRLHELLEASVASVMGEERRARYLAAKELEAADPAVEAIRAAADQYHASGFQNEDGNPIIAIMKDDGPKIDEEAPRVDEVKFRTRVLQKLANSISAMSGSLRNMTEPHEVQRQEMHLDLDQFMTEAYAELLQEQGARHLEAKELEAADPSIEEVREIIHKFRTFARIDVERAAIEAKIRAEGRAPEGSAFTGEIKEFSGQGSASKEYVNDVENQIRDLQRALSYTVVRLIGHSIRASSIHPDDRAWSNGGKIGDEHWFDAVARLMGKDHLHPDTLALIQVLNNDARRKLEEIK